jgi:DNA-binding XRE family transcriptional regulator
MITAAQITKARRLLGWPQMKLALEAGLAHTTIGSIETGKKKPKAVTLAIIQSTFEKAGIVFQEGEPVRLKKKK